MYSYLLWIQQKFLGWSLSGMTKASLTHKVIHVVQDVFIRDRYSNPDVTVSPILNPHPAYPGTARGSRDIRVLAVGIKSD